MAALTHRAFRELMAGFGSCDLAYSEMSNASSVVSNGRFEPYYLDTFPEPDRTVIQLVSGEAEDMERAAAFLAKREREGSLRMAGIDINFGCSAPEILKARGGAAWLQRPDEAVAMAARVKETYGGKVSAKLRAGWGGRADELVAFSRRLFEAGVERIVLHPRLPSEGYGRPPRWGLVERLAREGGAQIIGNGDIRSEADIARRLSETGCDGVMIGREAIRRPWIFHLARKRLEEPAFAMEIDLLEVAHRFVELLSLHQPEDFQKTRARRFFFYFCDNLRFGHYPRTAIQRTERPAEALRIFEAYLEANPEERIKSEISEASSRTRSAFERGGSNTMT
jgi:tRNA-dihydrouridine synthase